MKLGVKTGLDVLVGASFSGISGARVAVLANSAAVDNLARPIVDLLLASGCVKVVKLLAPEHGFGSTAQDMQEVSHTTDQRTGLPVISLYGDSFESLKPRQEYFRDIDILLVDLPDIGTRYYTFAQTMALCMEVAGQCGVKVVVLDRPNPINGVDIEGAPLLKSCRSFCGMIPVANRHGMTLGELALAYQKGFGSGEDAWQPISCELEIIECQDWKRGLFFNKLRLPWALPSPNMPTPDTALVYPGMCLFETTNVSEGRGTTKPFEIIGAPYIDSARWIEAALKEELPLEGALLRPATFTPQFNKWAGKVCHGLQLHVIDRQTFQPFRWGLALIAALKRTHPDSFDWREKAYEFVTDTPAIDLLYGNPLFRQVVDSGRSLTEVEAQMLKYERLYRLERRGIRLYGESK